MKRIVTAAVLAFMPLMLLTLQAQLLMKKHYEGRQPSEYYLKGAVTERDGQVVFTKDIAVPGKSAKDLFFAVGQWAEVRYMANMTRGQWFDANFFHNYENANILTADVDEMTISCQGDEELVFTNKVLNRDAARLFYLLKLSFQEEHVYVELSQIAYTYTFVERPERMKAEEWISDSEAFDKKGRLLKSVARFRVKTIDLKDELFKEIEEAAR